ncbi:Protein ANTAGONIST OF LIKE HETEROCHROMATIN PROTEIN 1 [Frankliniella fusca]|uniref:Protein ANTAGONIST OF LIKE HETEROCHROMATIN PROTEIN 1 n=1 Tax=Frankliniella fusca TaxID=407009 RepID=A0AAE1HF40_9NEOP|nr:Protein ANTAGONIST OF LIKE HETEROCHROMATIN PROTEIN 1 [Frankliniella fusca]
MVNPHVLVAIIVIITTVVQGIVTAVIRTRTLRRRNEYLRQIEEFRLMKRRQHRLRLSAFIRERRRKRMYRRKRSNDWWDNVFPHMDDEEFLENFRMKRLTFQYLCDSLRHRLQHEYNPINGVQGLSVEKTVAIAIYKLSSLAEYKLIGNQFGVHKSTVHNCLYAFCIAVTEELKNEHIRMPDSAEAKVIAQKFEGMTHIPQIIGAIDGSHIPITGPVDGRADFTNRKGYCSFVLQGLVDCNYLFRDISIKVPGCAHDATVFRLSNLFKNREEMIAKGAKEVDGMQVPFFIVGDPAYPLLPWLIKNYSYDGNTTAAMDNFNAHMNQGRIVVENAFGRLKGRWRSILRQSDIEFTFIPTLVATCCILHNIIEKNKDEYRCSWNEEVQNERDVPPQPDLEVYDEENEPVGADIREHLSGYLVRNFELRRSIRGVYAGV